MSIISLLSDFGPTDHYVSALKARIVSSASRPVQIFDISHSLQAFNMAQAAYILKSVFRDFPKGSIHLIGMEGPRPNGRYLACLLEEHYFLTADNGLISLVSDKVPEELILISKEKGIDPFPAKNILAPVAVSLLEGKPIQEHGERIDKIQRYTDRKPRATKQQISGHVIHVDHYGNLITNIDRRDFDILSKGRKYRIHFGKEMLDTLNRGYLPGEDGDCYALFNDLGFLQIGISLGHAQQLLGLGYDSPVSIIFED